MSNSIPSLCMTDFQIVLVSLGSRSETILRCIPWSFITVYSSIWIVCSAVTVFVVGIRCIIFVSRSTTTSIVPHSEFPGDFVSKFRKSLDKFVM